MGQRRSSLSDIKIECEYHVYGNCIIKKLKCIGRCLVVDIQRNEKMRNKWWIIIICLFFILMIPNILFSIKSEEHLKAFILSAIPQIFFIVFGISSTRNLKLILLFLSPLYIIIPFESWYILNYNEPSSSQIIAVVKESNIEEAAGLLGYYGIISKIFVGIILFIIAIIVSVKAPINKIPKGKKQKAILYVSLFSLILYYYVCFNLSPDANALQQQNFQENLSQDVNLTSGGLALGERRLSKSFPTGIIFRIKGYISEKRALENAIYHIDEIKFNPFRSIEIPNEEQEIYVLVIGESARPDHFQLNGYDRQTNPELSKIKNIFSFSNVVSPWSMTRLAVPVILTGKMDKNHLSPLDAGSLVTIFKQAGFKTYWISNQSPLGIHDSLISIHASKSDKLLYTNLGSYSGKSNYDIEIIKTLGHILNDKAQKKFIVLHMIGSHFPYEHRYPKEFDFFKKGEKINGPPLLLNQYDNTILYTDYILSKIIELIKTYTEENHGIGFMFYISDHGETLPTKECTQFGHGHNYDPEFMVASLLWLNENYSNRFKEIPKMAEKRKDYPFYSRQVFDTITSLAHINYNERLEENYWFSEKWKKEKRWVFGDRDFDMSDRGGACNEIR